MVAVVTKLREDFAQFVESMSRERLRDFLRDHTGENAYCDFKAEWPADIELARDVIGIANNGGGVIIIGVAENKDDGTFDIRGLAKLRDENEVNQKIERYLPKPLRDQYGLFSFSYTESEYPAIKDKHFQVVIVGDDPAHLPFLSESDGEEGSWRIRRNIIYVRKGSSTEPASYEQIQTMVSRRVETGYSSRPEENLLSHLEQLKLLYGQVSTTTILPGPLSTAIATMRESMSTMHGQVVRNPGYPKESYEDFIVRMVKAKKQRIEMILEVSGFTTEQDGASS
jgi:schlafen family protein